MNVQSRQRKTRTLDHFPFELSRFLRIYMLFFPLYYLAVTEWMTKWEKNGWKTVANKEVMNQDELKLLSRLCTKISVNWVNICIKAIFYFNFNSELTE